MFESNLHDDRFLPFEGSGAISEWQIELPSRLRQFDYDTIADLLLHLRYTAREGGLPLKQQANLELQTTLNAFVRTEGQQGLAQAFSLRHDLSSDWSRFLHPSADADGDHTITIPLSTERFPFFLQHMNIGINAIELFVEIGPTFAGDYNESTLKLSLQAGTTASNNPLNLASWNGLLRAAKSPAGRPGDWTLTAWLDAGNAEHQRLDPDAIKDIQVLCRYTFS